MFMNICTSLNITQKHHCFSKVSQLWFTWFTRIEIDVGRIRLASQMLMLRFLRILNADFGRLPPSREGTFIPVSNKSTKPLRLTKHCNFSLLYVWRRRLFLSTVGPQWPCSNTHFKRPTIHTEKTCLNLHNCFVYFHQKINPWRMVFYFFILLLRLLSY